MQQHIPRATCQDFHGFLCAFLAALLVVHQELKAIPGSEYLDSIDGMGLKVCVREGTQIAIHPDQCRQWTNSGTELLEKFSVLKDLHNEKYLNLLAPIIKRQSGAGDTEGASNTGAVVSVDDVEPAANTDDAGAAPAAGLTFESLEKLAEADPIETKCVSEIQGVNLIRCKSGKIFLCSDKDRILAKWTSLGGFGTGKHFS